MTQKQTSPEMMKGGCLVVLDQIASALPLELTTVSIQVSGPLASAAVTQRFGNPLEQAVDLEYLFPLPEEAAITDFMLKIGERTVRAELKEIGEANQHYEDARRSGQRAGLFEQRRENLFSVRLANVQPRETILATVRYQQRLAFNDEEYELVFPMGLTPKYDSPQAPGEGTGVHAPVARKDEPVGPVEIHVALDAGFASTEPHSPSHAVEVLRLDERRFQVQLAGREIPDHDFVLRYSPTGEQAHTAAWLTRSGEGHYFLASLLPPRAGNEAAAAPREFIFVLDRSGSMGGEPILQARNALRACLRSLTQADTFRILLFDDRLEWYRNEPSAVTQPEIDLADRFLGQVNARGGTEIIASLEASLGLPPDPRRTRFVVFLTDGAVSAELRTLDMLRQKVGGARIFTFGIGPSVNRALLKRMAGMGRGMAEFLQADEDIEGAIIRFQDRVSFPVLTDLQLNLEGGDLWDLYPARLPDLYVGQPLEICGRVKPAGSVPLVLTFSGRRGGETVRLKAAMSAVGTDEPAVARLWARARMDDLLDEAAVAPERQEKIRSAVIELALTHHLVTRYTALVGIDQSAAAASGQPITIQVAQPRPRGLDWDVAGPAGVTPMMLSQPSGKMSMPVSFTPMAAMRRRKNLADGMAQDASLPVSQPRLHETNAIQPPLDNPEALLRWLARTQQLDGSWGTDVERTSAALLAFVRAGQTTQKGGFRVAVRRAVTWLQVNLGDGPARFFRAFALGELANATGLDAHAELARAARAALPEPVGRLEQAAAGRLVSQPLLAGPVGSLDELRLAVLLGQKPQVTPGKFTSDLELTWLACV